MGLLRVAPTKPGTTGSIRVRYEERPSDYAAFDSVQLAVVDASAFASEGRAFADATLAWTRSTAGDYAAEVEAKVAGRALLVVAYGPFEGPDAGRPLSLARTVSLQVLEAKDANWRWVDAEVGEMNVKAWTAHPAVRRGGPARDPVAGADHWFELRPLVFYDRTRVRAPGDPEPPEVATVRKEADALLERSRKQASEGRVEAAAELEAEANELLARAGASDDRLLLPAALAERLRRPPLRWK
jgi:hypothetical protein